MTSHDATTHPRNRSSPGREGKPARLYYIDCKRTVCALHCMFCFDHATTLALWTGRGNTFGDVEDCAPYWFFQHLPHMPMNCRYNGGAPTDPQASAGNAPSIPNIRCVRTDSDVSWKRTVNSTCSLGMYWLSGEMETYRQFKMFVGRVLTHMAARNAPSNIRWARNELRLSRVNVPSIPNVRWARTLNFRKVRLLRTDPQTWAGNVPTISYVQSTTYLTTLTVTPATQRRTFGWLCITNWKWCGSGHGLIYGTIPSDIFLERLRKPQNPSSQRSLPRLEPAPIENIQNRYRLTTFLGPRLRIHLHVETVAF